MEGHKDKGELLVLLNTTCLTREKNVLYTSSMKRDSWMHFYLILFNDRIF